MRWRLIIGALLASTIHANADMYPDASNAVLPVARTNLGLGTMATQSANAVAITGGTASLSSLTLPVTFPACPGANPIDMLAVNVGGYLKTDEMSACTVQGIKSAMVIPNTYTQAPWPPTAFAAYVTNNNNVNTPSNNSAVGYFGVIGSGVDGASLYGSNQVVANAPQPMHAPISGSGHDFIFMVGQELDFNIFKKGTIAPSGHLYGLLITGASETVPTVEALGIYVQALDGTAGTKHWQTVLASQDSAADNFASIGAIALGANSSSQAITFNSSDVSSTRHQTRLLTSPEGVMEVDGRLAVSAVGQALDPSAVAFFKTGTDQDLEIRPHISLATVVALVVTNDALNTNLGLELLASPLKLGVGNVLMPGLPASAGTGGLYVCADGVGQLYRKATCP